MGVNEGYPGRYPIRGWKNSRGVSHSHATSSRAQTPGCFNEPLGAENGDFLGAARKKRSQGRRSPDFGSDEVNVSLTLTSSHNKFLRAIRFQFIDEVSVQLKLHKI